MIPVIKRFVHDLLWSEERARLWFRGVLAWTGAMALQLQLTPNADLAALSLKGWLIKLAIAAAVATPLLVKAGDKNSPAAP